MMSPRQQWGRGPVEHPHLNTFPCCTSSHSSLCKNFNPPLLYFLVSISLSTKTIINENLSKCANVQFRKSTKEHLNKALVSENIANGWKIKYQKINNGYLEWAWAWTIMAGIRLLLLSLMVGGKNVVTGEGKRKDSGKINGEAVGEEYNQLMKRKD